MVRGGVLSVGLHGLVVGALALQTTLFGAAELPEMPPIIPIEMITIGPETNLAVAGEPEKDQLPPLEEVSAKEPPETKTRRAASAGVEAPPQRPATPAPVAAAPAPQPATVSAPAPSPAPAPAEIKEAQPKLVEAPPAPSESPAAAPETPPDNIAQTTPTAPPPVRPTPKPEKKKLDLNRLTAKLDKLATEKPQPRRDPDRKITEITIGEGGVSQNRLNSKLSVSELDLLRARLRDNWSPNHGAPGVEQMYVVVRISLKRDGRLSRTPQIVRGDNARQSKHVFRVFAESAVRAVQKSQPFPLPPEKYENWRVIEINFNLKEMYG